MSWQHTIYAYPILLSTTVSLVLAAYAVWYGRQHRQTPTLQTFAAMNIAIAIWTGFSAVKLLSTDPALQFQTYRLLYFGSSSVGPLLLLFVLTYTDRITVLRPSIVLAVFAVPVLFWALLFTNPYDVVIVESYLVDADGLVVMRTQTGPAHILFSFTYALFIALVTIGVLLHESFKRGWSYLPQAVLMGVAISTPVIVSALTSAGIPPFTLDSVNFVPASTAVSAVALSVATFRYRLLDLRPIANRTVVDHSPDAMLVIDTAERIVHINDAANTLFHSDRPLRTAPVTDVLPELRIDTESEQILEYQSPTGPVAIEVRARPLQRRDEHLGWVIVCRDVTERRRQQAELEAFSAVVSHDLRAPLRNAERYLSLFEETTDSTLEADAHRLLERSKENTQRAQTMLSDLLAYSRIETTPVEFEPVEMDRTLDTVLDTLAHDIDSRNATVERSSLPQVRGIDHLLVRLFQNLLANALKHGIADSSAEESSLTISVEAARKGSFWEFTVADDGVGMNPEELAYVFDLFSQGSNADFDAGTGMGLAICHKIVDRHGGQIDIQSAPDQGTSVMFTLPAVEPET